jgi:hypothetical protein
MSAPKHRADPGRFRVVTRYWPNGTRYFTVENLAGMAVAGKRGCYSKFYDRSKAEAVRDQMNGKGKADATRRPETK